MSRVGWGGVMLGGGGVGGGGVGVGWCWGRWGWDGLGEGVGLGWGRGSVAAYDSVRSARNIHSVHDGSYPTID